MNVRTGLLRVALCLMAGFGLLTAWTCWNTAADRLSGVTLAAILATGLAGAALLLAVAPARFSQTVLHFLRRVAGQIDRSEPTAHPIMGWTLIVAAILGCFVNLNRFFVQQQNPWDDDQGAYLQRAEEIHQAGGPPRLLTSMFNGTFEEANRQPLYLAFLSIHPDFQSGKCLSTAIGIITLLLCTFLIARRYGVAVAGVFAVLLTTNYAFCFFSTRVVSEVLVVLFSSVAWLTCRTWGQPHSVTSESASTRHMARRFAGAGALLGLAWLSKATGLLLLIGYVIWGLLEFWRQRRKSRNADERASSKPWAVALACLLGAFLLVGSPLLVRNVRRFGNPFYNVNSLLLFADHYKQFDAMLASHTTTSEAAREYFVTHSVASMAQRELTGLVWESFIILRSLGPTPLDDSRVLFGIPLALLAVATMAVRRRPEHRLLLVWGVLHWVVFAWYVPIAAGERFVMPLLIPLLATAADGVVRLWPTSRNRWTRLLVILGILWCACWVVATCESASLAERLS